MLTLVLLNPDIPCLYKQYRSRSVGFEANWSASALFPIKYVNLYQQPGSSNLIGWKLEVDVAVYSAWQGLRGLFIYGGFLIGKSIYCVMSWRSVKWLLLLTVDNKVLVRILLGGGGVGSVWGGGGSSAHDCTIFHCTKHSNMALPSYQ